MDSPLYLPVRLVKPVKLMPGANLAGLFLPNRPTRGPMIVADWEGATWALHLEGELAFRFFEIKADISVAGVLIEDCELIADIGSSYPASMRSPAPGDLMLKDGKAFLVGLPAGGFFDEVAEFALWVGHPVASTDAAAHFARWKLVVNDGEKIVDLFSHDGVPPAP